MIHANYVKHVKSRDSRVSRDSPISRDGFQYWCLHFQVKASKLRRPFVHFRVGRTSGFAWAFRSTCALALFWRWNTLAGMIVTELILKLAKSETVTLNISPEIDLSNLILKLIQPNLGSVTKVGKCIMDAPTFISFSRITTALAKVSMTSKFLFWLCEVRAFLRPESSGGLQLSLRGCSTTCWITDLGLEESLVAPIWTKLASRSAFFSSRFHGKCQIARLRLAPGSEFFVNSVSLQTFGLDLRLQISHELYDLVNRIRTCKGPATRSGQSRETEQESLHCMELHNNRNLVLLARIDDHDTRRRHSRKWSSAPDNHTRTNGNVSKNSWIVFHKWQNGRICWDSLGFAECAPFLLSGNAQCQELAALGRSWWCNVHRLCRSGLPLGDVAWMWCLPSTRLPRAATRGHLANVGST